jgi:hypothetical protein
MGFLDGLLLLLGEVDEGPGVQAEDVRRPLVRWIENTEKNSQAHRNQ